MKFTLPKKKTAPLIIFAAFSILLTLILGILQLNQVFQYSYKEKLVNYDMMTEEVIMLLKQELENQYQTLQLSANLIAAGDIDEESIAVYLPVIKDKNSYIDLAIIDQEGKGINIAGDRIDIGKEPYYVAAKEGKSYTSNKMRYTDNNQPVITFALPIIDKGNQKGVFIAEVDAIIKESSINDITQRDKLIYIINENRELVSYLEDTQFEKFDYNELVSDGYFREEAVMSRSIFNLKEFYTKSEGSYIWVEAPLGINNWSVLIGGKNTFSSIEKDIFWTTNIMWILISAIMVFAFTIMIVMQRRSNHKVIEMLYLDPVTGGSNWHKFRIQVDKIITSKLFEKNNYALINFDINGFTKINDDYGYQKGDEVLRDIYKIIETWSKSDELYTRYAADQFYILILYNTIEDISERINILNDKLRELRYMKTSLISYGVYIIAHGQDSVNRMGEFATIAKNNNKNSSQGNISFFDEEAKNRFFEEEKIKNTMIEAIKNNEFQVYLQPKYAIKNEKIYGAEALVRWFDTKGKIISPGFFIPVFEKNGFITQLDFYMLNKVCQIIRGWIDKGYKPLPISVNISRLHFGNPNLTRNINDIVDKYKIPHELIELELTESAFLQDKKMIIETVTMLRSYGYLISMDDFGSGYSSLNSLKDLPLDVVKLDGELFQINNEVERGLTVIRNTIKMAKDLHMIVVAECIETREQVEYLYKVGCDMIQGYYYAKPMPVDLFEEKYFSYNCID